MIFAYKIRDESPDSPLFLCAFFTFSAERVRYPAANGAAGRKATYYYI